jgi:hypothetical protein
VVKSLLLAVLPWFCLRRQRQRRLEKIGRIANGKEINPTFKKIRMECFNGLLEDKKEKEKGWEIENVHCLVILSTYEHEFLIYNLDYNPMACAVCNILCRFYL